MIKCNVCGLERTKSFYDKLTGARCINSQCRSPELFYYPSGKLYSDQYLNHQLFTWTKPVIEISSHEKDAICEDCAEPFPLSLLNKDHRCLLCEKSFFSGLPKADSSSPMPKVKPPKLDNDKPASKYMKQIHPFVVEGSEEDAHMCEIQYFVDVYRVLDAFETGSASLDHAAKKLLCAGNRGVKDKIQDLEESIWSIQQEINLLKQKG